jgi:hypothetical protein
METSPAAAVIRFTEAEQVSEFRVRRVAHDMVPTRSWPATSSQPTCSTAPRPTSYPNLSILISTASKGRLASVA